VVREFNVLLLGFFYRYLSILDVTFISGDDDRSVLGQVHLEFLDPLGDLAPRL